MSGVSTTVSTAIAYRARFPEAEVHLDGPDSLVLECTLENASSVRWEQHAADGDAEPSGDSVAAVGPVQFGYKVFDSATGALRLDGARTPLGQTSEPGSRTSLRAEIHLPRGEGRYRVVLSPVHEQVAWFHERGSESLVLDVTSDRDGKLTASPVRRVTRHRMRLERLTQMLLRSFWYPLRTMSQHRSLIDSMVRRDIQGRYRGSMGGTAWTLIHPLFLMLAYYFVFSIVLRVRFGPEEETGSFTFYFLSGMVPWLAFSEAVGRAPNIILENTNFVKRIIFPLEILPVNLTLTGLITELFGMVIFLTAVVAFGPGLGWSILYFPVILIPQLMLTMGLCWFLAALGVFLRDTGQAIGILLTVWFFATPICYPASALPQGWLWLFQANPMYTLVEAYRDIFLIHTAPDFYPMATFWLISLFAFWFGHSWFYKVKKSFADLI